MWFVFSFQEGLSSSNASLYASRNGGSVSDLFYRSFAKQEKLFISALNQKFRLWSFLLPWSFLSTLIMNALNRGITLVFSEFNPMGVQYQWGCAVVKILTVLVISQLHDSRLNIHSVLYKWITLRHISKQGMILENYDTVSRVEWLRLINFTNDLFTKNAYVQ